MNPFSGEIAAVATAMCWTVTSLLFESASRRVGSLSVNLLRLVVALCLLAGLGMWRRGLPLPTDAPPCSLMWLGLSGLAGFTFGDLCLFRAFVVIGARLSTLIMALVPLFTAVLGFAFLGERLSILDAAGVVLTLGGIAAVLASRKANGGGTGQSTVPIRGLLLALGGAVGQAVGLVLAKHGMLGYDPFASAEIRVMAGLMGFAVLFTAIGWWPKVKAAMADGAAMARTAAGGFFGPFLGVSLSLIAVSNTEAGVAATLMALNPVFIIAPHAIIRREPIPAVAVIGAVVAVSGSAMLFL